MNLAHWHLALNHLPVISLLIGSLILLAGFIVKNSPVIKRTALFVIIFAALAAIPAFLSGEGAEEVVEKIPGIAESVIEDHEDAGKIFLALIEGLGLLVLVTFTADWFKKRFVSSLYVLTLLACLGISVFGLRVANSGGKVRHTEIHDGGVGTSNEAIKQNNEYD